MLVKTIYDANQLKEEFRRMNRDYYSYEGYEALINVFEECDDGQPTELDVIAICCDFTEDEAANIIEEYENCFNEYLEDYGENPEEMSQEEKEEHIEDFLNYYTYAVETTPGSYLYQKF